MTPRDLLAVGAAWMRPRRGRFLRAAAVLLLAAPGLLALAGCDPRQALYFLQPFEPTIAAPGPDLRGKHVVVIAKAAPNALNDFALLDRELTREFVAILRENVKKITVEDPDKVYAWDQAHPSWTDPAELAVAFDADMVIFLEVGHFQIEHPSTPGMFQGNSSTRVSVVERAHPTDDRKRPMTDRPKETRPIYSADKDSVFPIHNPLPASAEVSPTAFKNKYLKLVATELSWNFLPHARGDNIQDVDFHGS